MRCSHSLREVATILLLGVFLLLVPAPTFADATVTVTGEPQDCQQGSGSDGVCAASEEQVAAIPPVAAASECGIWIAPSTLPGTGIGMFAGRAFSDGEELMPAGDHTVPIVDIVYHNKFDLDWFLWDEYTWIAHVLGMDHLGLFDVNVCSPGFGATANSFMDFVNVMEGMPEESIPHDLHRSKDPGAGAFTYFHSRMATASEDIAQGQELFVSYGNQWFATREEILGPIPISGDHSRAEGLYKKFLEKQEGAKLNQTENDSIADLDNAFEDLWDSFVVNETTWNSRVLSALPPKEDYAKMLGENGLVGLKKESMRRSTEWFEKHGVCADHLHINVSTILQAGHGAFASRFLPKGSAILPIPLIHLPERRVMDMIEIVPTKTEPRRNVSSHQLLLNYCLGHANSTLLLSPYGTLFNLINHNQTQADVRLQWAAVQRSNHQPKYLAMPVSELESLLSAVVSMELIALRDIQENEEIFLDYGDEWEQAWEEHVANWKPTPAAETYVSASELNLRNEPLRTEFEQIENPYPSNVRIKFDIRFSMKGFWQSHVKKGTSPDKLKESRSERNAIDAEILRSELKGDSVFYAISITKKEEKKSGKPEETIVEDVPREALWFEDKPYTGDMFLANVFRHDIRIPDDIFPDAWKNK